MIMMMWKAFLSLLLFSTVVLAQNDQITHLMVNDANLIETQQGYGVMAPNLASVNWKTVSVNGDQIQIIAPTCQMTVMTMQQLANSQQQQSTLDEARRFLASALSNQPQSTSIYRSGVAKISMRGNSATMSFARNIGISSFNSNGLSITKYDDNNMSISKPGLSNNVNRIFVTGDVVTFVYNDGRVNMKPANCLENIDSQLVQELKREANEAQVNFNNNMNQFHRNMQQNMQNMQHNLNSMFTRNNFPFNNNQFPFNNNQFPFNNNQFPFNNNQYPFNNNQFPNNNNYNNNNQQQQSSQQQTYGFGYGIIPQATNLLRNLPILGPLTRGFPFGQAQAAAGPLSSSFTFGR